VDLELLRERARIIRRVRAFFDERGYLEVDTPLLSPDLIPESCLEVFETSRILPRSPAPGGGGRKTAAPYWLIPSPEIWMKKLIARHRVNLYQVCKCFRNGESTGRLHSPEFTMLEYYTMGDYEDSLRITGELLAALLPSAGLPSPPRFTRLTMEEAFIRCGGLSLSGAVREGRLEEEARRLGLDPIPGLDTAALYDLIFIHAVEPRLPKNEWVVLTGYPAFVPCLAKRSAGGTTAERWELYRNGVELANCYTEEGDPEMVRAFFKNEGKAKEERALVRHGVDGDYWKLFRDFPPCSGTALGLDRLIMILLGKKSIDGVLPFPMT
jgi:lysyl-tRNA synthetase class 2